MRTVLASTRRLAARVAVAAALLVLVAASTALSPVTRERSLLNRAIERAGGVAALDAAKVLAWSGDATVFAGERRIEISVDTWVEPFVQAHSTSWLREQGRDSARTLEITASGGEVLRGGRRERLPDSAASHERQQFAIYGLMRLVDLRAGGVQLDALPVDAQGLHGLRVKHRDAPETVLLFDAGFKLVGARNTVRSAEGDRDIAQVFAFEGEIASGGVRWPRVLRIAQDGQPFFALTLKTFAVRDGAQIDGTPAGDPAAPAPQSTPK